MTKYLSATFTGLLMAAGFLYAPELLAQGGLVSEIDCAGNLNASGGCQTSFRMVMVTMLNWVLGFLGLIAIIAVIYGGYLYLLSGGDESQAGKGRKVITYAVIGIVIILLSFALVNTILGIASGVQG